MHLIIVHEELLHPSHQVGLDPMRPVRVQGEGAEEGGERDVIAVGAEVHVHLVVHGELVDRVDTIFDNFLDDAEAFRVEDQHEAAVEAGEQDGLVIWVASHHTGVIQYIFVVLAVLREVV